MISRAESQLHQQKLDTYWRTSEQASVYLPHDSPLSRTIQHRQQGLADKHMSRSQSAPNITSKNTITSHIPGVQGSFRVQKLTSQLPQRKPSHQQQFSQKKPFHHQQRPQVQHSQTSLVNATPNSASLSFSRLQIAAPESNEESTLFRLSLPKASSYPCDGKRLPTAQLHQQLIKPRPLSSSSHDYCESRAKEMELEEADASINTSSDFDDSMEMDSPQVNRVISHPVRKRSVCESASFPSVLCATKTPLPSNSVDFNHTSSQIPSVSVTTPPYRLLVTELARPPPELQSEADFLMQSLPTSHPSIHKCVSSIVRMEDEGISPASLRILEAVSMRCSVMDEDSDCGERAIAEIALARERGRLENPFL